MHLENNNIAIYNIMVWDSTHEICNMYVYIVVINSTKVQTLGAICLKYWNIWIEDISACIW